MSGRTDDDRALAASSRAVWALLVVAALVAILAATAGNRRVTGEAGPKAVRKVVVVGIPALSLDDVEAGVMPNLDRLADRGSIAATNVGIRADAPNLNGAYATLGAGNRTRAYPGDVAVVATDARTADGRTVGQALEAQTGIPAEGDLAIGDHPQIAQEVDPESNSQTGALADALRAAGLRTALVSNAGALDVSAATAEPAPAALAIAGSDGSIDGGTVSRDLLVPTADTPAGTSNPRAYARAVEAAIDDAAVVFVDPGDHQRTTRAIAAAELQAEIDEAGGPEPSAPEDELGTDIDPEELRLTDLRHADRVLGRLEAVRGADTMIIVVGITPAGPGFALTPMVITGPSVPAGYLDSPSTHRPGLVALTDLAPTILSALGVPAPDGMIGEPLRYRTADATWDEARHLDQVLEERHQGATVMGASFVIVQVVLYGALLGLLAWRGLPLRRQGFFAFAALVCAAWPVSTFLIGLVPSLYGYGGAALAVSWAIAIAIAAVALRFHRHHLDPLLIVCALTVATLAADLVTGAHLQLSGFFGYTPSVGSRFTGIGNASFAILGACTVLTMAVIVGRARDRAAAWWLATAIGALVILVDGAPWIGADVGGILTFTPIFGLVLWSLRGGRVRARALIVAGIAACVVLGVVVGLEALRDPAERSHIGRFFLNAAGDGVTEGTLRRKWDANTALMSKWPVLWAIPFATAGAVVALVRSRVLGRVAANGSTERVAFLGIIGVGLLGWLVNDSGLIVLGLAAVYLGPLLALSIRAQDVPNEVDEGDKVHEGDKVDDRDGPDVPAASQPTGPARDAVVVALVPAKDRADSVAESVDGLRGLSTVDRIVVIDDGSHDDTGARAHDAGADVVVLPANRGKSAAIFAGIAAAPEATVFLLIDADLASTAAAADLLLEPVLEGRADLTVGTLPPAEGKAGFGVIKKLAGRGVVAGCGVHLDAPLSGQRAVRADLLREMGPVDRFGLEVAMTIDVAAAGGHVLEVPVPMDHRHTGRSFAGFRHRAKQGLDIARALWPRMTTRPLRLGLVLASTTLLLFFAIASGARQQPSSSALGAEADRVLVFGFSPFGFSDFGTAATPNLNRLVDEGAVGAMSVRAVHRRPTAAEGYATIGAGYRLSVNRSAGVVLPRDAPVGNVSAADHVSSLTGDIPEGELVAVGGPAVARGNQGHEAAASPGVLGELLHDAGFSSAAVGSSDQGQVTQSDGVADRPAGLAAMTTDFGIPHGQVDDVLDSVPGSPYGVKADRAAVVAAALEQLDRRGLVVVDPGDLSRADSLRGEALDDAAGAHWKAAVAHSDAILGDLVSKVDDRTLVLVVSVAPPGGKSQLTPMVAWGAGVHHGTLQSPATKRDGLVAITDVAPTVLGALGIDEPVEMTGSALRVRPGAQDLDHLRRINDDTDVRERTYYGQSWYFILAHYAVYGAALLFFVRRFRLARGTGLVRWASLVLASYPAGSFLVRLIPGLTSAGLLAQPLVTVALAILIATLAERRRSRHPLATFGWIAGSTTAVIVVDTWLGTPMQASSWLGSSFHNAGRFYGIPNTTFAVLGACSLLWAVIHIERSPRPDEALVTVGCAWSLALVSAGLPMLGADVGTLITLAPVYALVLWRLSGRRIRLRNLALAGAAMVTLVTGAALADLSRPPAARSHLGRFAERLRDDGVGTLWETFARKQSANFRILGASVWTDLIPVVVVFLVVVLMWNRRWSELLPPDSARRIGFLSVIGAALLGFASNDSGPIVIALFICFLPAFVLALAADDGVLGPPSLVAAGEPWPHPPPGRRPGLRATDAVAQERDR